MITSAKKDGRVGIVIDNGVLFRGGVEAKIREKVLKDDLIECVILLPEKLFYNTGAPGTILVLNKAKPADREGKVLFINASQEYEKHPEVRKLNRLSKENIKKIADVYRSFKEVEGFSKVVSQDELAAEKYNLNVTLYVFPEEEYEDIDIKKEWTDLEKMESEIHEVEKRIREHLEELGLTG